MYTQGSYAGMELLHMYMHVCYIEIFAIITKIFLFLFQDNNGIKGIFSPL